MEFFELVAILSTAVGIPAIIFYNVRKMVEAKSNAKVSQSGSALRTSELEVLIEDAVQRSVQPLLDRIEGVESKPESPHLLVASQSPLLGDDFAEFDDDDLELATVERSRARS